MVDLEAAGTPMLLIHDGELADVRELLDELGLGFSEASPQTVQDADYRTAPIVIATPQFLSNRLNAGDVGDGLRVAIIDAQAKTLLAMLSRGGVEWVVRRPFHPSALRGLLLHLLYQGPEKRRGRRVSVGAAVHFQAGWRKRGAVLAEVSEQDCRLLSAKPVDVGKRLKLRLPGELVGGRSLQIEARVVRTAQADSGDRSHEICLVFEALEAYAALQLKDLVNRHERGPAVLKGRAARHLERTRATDPSEQERLRRTAISVSQLASGDEEEAAVEAQLDSERRTDLRHDYRRRVIALSKEATRVLVGRDISRQGMRVDPAPNLQLGNELQIALHAPSQETPLVIDVRVHRDDGEDGLVLHFVELPESAASYLEEMLGELSGPGGADAPEAGQTFVVSEILDPDPAS
jgi:hypothetical protein